MSRIDLSLPLAFGGDISHVANSDHDKILRRLNLYGRPYVAKEIAIDHASATVETLALWTRAARLITRVPVARINAGNQEILFIDPGATESGQAFNGNDHPFLAAAHSILTFVNINTLSCRLPQVTASHDQENGLVYVQQKRWLRPDRLIILRPAAFRTMFQMP